MVMLLIAHQQKEEALLAPDATFFRVIRAFAGWKFSLAAAPFQNARPFNVSTILTILTPPTHHAPLAPFCISVFHLFEYLWGLR
jgi:hypothetical protein